MINKRGYNAELELFHFLSKKGYAVVRVAGSGIAKETSCDLLAGKKSKKFAIEVKASGKNKKYFDKKQIKDLIKFSDTFGLKPLIAIKFLRKGWFFILPQKLKKTKKGFFISIEDIKKRGKKLEFFK